MIFADFKCIKCNYIFEGIKNRVLDDWGLQNCPKCNSTSKRVFSSIIFDIALGHCGNASNGYQTTVTKKRSTKYGMYKGIKV